MAKKTEKSLTADQKNWVIDCLFNSYRSDIALKKIDMSRREFAGYLRRDHEFRLEYEQALRDSCTFLENDLLNIDKIVDHHKMASAMVNSISKVLAFRNPEKYGPKLDLNVSAVISIKQNLAEANSRLLRDVSPAIIELTQSVSVPVKK